MDKQSVNYTAYPQTAYLVHNQKSLHVLLLTRHVRTRNFMVVPKLHTFTFSLDEISVKRIYVHSTTRSLVDQQHKMQQSASKSAPYSKNCHKNNLGLKIILPIHI